MSIPYHPPLVFGNDTYALDHLDPHEMIVGSTKAAKDLCIRIRYTNHCFSRGHKPETDPPDAMILPDRSRGIRVFDPTRYALSKSLPEFMLRLTLPKARVYQPTARRNWLHSIPIESDLGPYHVFFEIRRAPKDESQDLNLTVESAYPQAGRAPPQVLGPMRFELLAGKVYRGEPTTTRR